MVTGDIGESLKGGQAWVYIYLHTFSGASLWLSGKESASQCRRCKFNPCSGKIP